MEIKLNVVISPSEEFLSLITAILDRSQTAAPVKAAKGKKEVSVSNPVETAEEMKDIEAAILEKKALLLTKPDPAAVIPASDVKETPAAVAPSVSLETIKTLASEKVKVDHLKVTKLIKETFGVEALSKLPPEQYGAFYEQLKAI